MTYNNFMEGSYFSPLGKQLNDYLYGVGFDEQFIEIMYRDHQKVYKKLQQAEKMFFERREHSNMPDKQQMRMNAERYQHIHKIHKKQNLSRAWLDGVDINFQISGLPLNTMAFMTTINLLGNQTQREYWIKLIYDGSIIGSYGQTELGHGSNVQGLQTTADYNQQDDTFILNSSKITSSKFWPGVLGAYSTHAVIQARTFVKQKYIGVQTFIIEIRDSNLQTCNGVQVGDIGPKLGFARVDNGFLVLKGVRIPRQQLLMRYVQVQKGGKVNGLQNKQAIKYGYGSMLNLRVRLILAFSMGFILRPSIQYYRILDVTNPIDLSTKDVLKKKIIQYICVGHGFVIANVQTRLLYKNFLKAIEDNDLNSADQNLVDCHIISSTFKALASSTAIKVLSYLISEHKLAAMKSSYITTIFCDAIPAVTYQGDNTVLLQQTAKYILMKSSEQMQQKRQKPSAVLDCNNLENVVKILQYIVSCQVTRFKDIFQKQTQNGVAFNSFWNQKYQEQMIKLAKIWGIKTCVNGVISQINKKYEINDLLQKISKVFVFVVLQQEASFIQLYGFKIKQCEIWNKFDHEQFMSILNPNRPVTRKIQHRRFSSFYLPGRQNDWAKPRL